MDDKEIGYIIDPTLLVQYKEMSFRLLMSKYRIQVNEFIVPHFRASWNLRRRLNSLQGSLLFFN